MVMLAVIVVLVLVIIWQYKFWAIREASRELWTEHVWLTREFLRTITWSQCAAADAAAIQSLLMTNQQNIGSWLGGFYGATFGAAATSLLQTHINLVAAAAQSFSSSAPNGDATAIAAMYTNGNAIADAMSSTIPCSDAVMRAHMKTHLDLTVAEFQQMQTGGAPSYAAYDQVHAAAMEMSDYISSHIALRPWRLL